MVLLLAACAETREPDAEPTLATYTSDCEAALGPFPDLDCDASAEVRIVAGVDGTCDTPSWISGCDPGSRVGSLRDGNTVYNWVCRQNTPDTPDGLYDDVALIGQDLASGATCFWGAPADGEQRPGRMPTPGGSDDGGYWADLPTLADLRCRDCHDNDPILVTPWIRTAGATESHPEAPFELLGADVLEGYAPGGWTPGLHLIHDDAAPCTQCHALTNRFTCALAGMATGATQHPLVSEAARSWPRDRWMDTFDPDELVERYPTEADWDAVYGVATATILACCSVDLSSAECWDQQPSRSRM